MKPGRVALLIMALAGGALAALAVRRTLGSAPHATLAARPLTRAYEGAPPVIPHPVREWGRGNCLSCHDEGLIANKRAIAVPKPHPTLGDCVQCHVEQVTQATWKQSKFEGWHPDRPRHRAYPGAPPVIPHRVWLRDNCLSCHGERGYPEIQTPHPQWTNCLQCHVEQKALAMGRR